MHILVAGLSHKTAPVEVREKLALAAEELGSAAASLVGGAVSEAVVLSTCNRTEVYAVADTFHGGREVLLEFLRRRGGEIQSHLYLRNDREAVAHLFRVACGLDSMIPGETQVLGQIKDAYRRSRDAGSVGKLLHSLFQQALGVAKRAHTETAIGQNAVSVGYAALELARKVFGDLRGHRVLLIGAGKMGELTARHLHENGAARVLVANRTRERARQLAQRFGWVDLPFPEVAGQLAEVDVVVSSTGAPGTVLEAAQVLPHLRRRHRPLFIFDIAVPRDVDPAVGKLADVFLYDIDDLQAVVEANLELRAREAAKVEGIVVEETDRFEAFLRELAVVPLIRSLRDKAESIRRRELERAMAKLPELDQRQRQVVEQLSCLLVNKLLNDPTLALKESMSGAESQVYVEAMSRLFRLERGKAEEAGLWRLG